MVTEEVTNCGRKINVTKSLTKKGYLFGYVAKKTKKKKILCNNITKQLSKLKYLVYVVTD